MFNLYRGLCDLQVAAVQLLKGTDFNKATKESQQEAITSQRTHSNTPTSHTHKAYSDPEGFNLQHLKSFYFFCQQIKLH